MTNPSFDEKAKTICEQREKIRRAHEKLRSLYTEMGFSLPEENGPLDDLWEKWVMSGDPQVLADWIDGGGEIDDQARGSIVGALRDEIKPTNRGGQDIHRDYMTYLEIREIERQRKDENHSAAVCEFIERHGGGMEERTIKERYRRGSKLYK
jgi:hypothetical protein